MLQRSFIVSVPNPIASNKIPTIVQINAAIAG